VTGVV